MKRRPIGSMWGNRTFLFFFLVPGLVSFPFFSKSVFSDENWTGRGVMEEVFKRHELFPYVFETQTMILMDGAGNRDVRTARRFSRVEKDGTIKYLLVLDNPVEIRGVAVLAVRNSSGLEQSNIYLPAFGGGLKSSVSDDRGSHFLGTDFTIADLTTEVLSDFRYARVTDRKIDGIVHFVIEAFPKNGKIERKTGYSLRRHFIRKDNFFIVRTDYLDRRGRFLKRRSQHDLKKVDGDMWRANMILMENHKEGHKTLIKINQRVFSRDYVPSEMFTFAWLLENRHIQGTQTHIFRKTSEVSGNHGSKLPDVSLEQTRQNPNNDFINNRH